MLRNTQTWIASSLGQRIFRLAAISLEQQAIIQCNALLGGVISQIGELQLILDVELVDTLSVSSDFPLY